MGNKSSYMEHVTGYVMLEAIRKNSEEGVIKAWERAKSERVIPREEAERKGLTDEQLDILRNEALLNYFTKVYNFEGTYIRGNMNKMTFIEAAFSLGYHIRARQIQKLMNEHRLSMGLETDTVLLNNKNKGKDLLKEGLGKATLSEDGKKAKENLQKWLQQNKTTTTTSSSSSNVSDGTADHTKHSKESS